MRQELRRSGWLTVLGAAAAGTYVASRARSHPRRPPPRAEDPNPAARVVDDVPVAEAMPEPSRPSEPGATATDDPTGPPTIVAVTMETSPALALPEHNGSSLPRSEQDAPTARERVARPLALPRARRPSAAALVGLAAVAGLGAIVLGVLALVLGLRSDSSEPGTLAAETGHAIALLSKPTTERIPFERSAGAVVLAVGTGARGVLVLSGLAPAAAGKAYQAWVVGSVASQPMPAAVFSGEEKVVPLTRPVRPGATVGITVEDAAGVDTPTQRLRIVARRP